MARALGLAASARGQTLPNPMVGALVVRSGRVVGRGFHSRAGRPHAEPLALAQAGRAARGATLYVSLEPCAHHGRTPPCLDAVLRSGVRRVVAAMADPDPRVRGRSLRRLRAAGIAVRKGVLEGKARALNEEFITRVEKGRPFVTLKLAQSLDGRIAAAGGRSRWISGPSARRWARRLRAKHEGLLVGINTVLADDPRLTAGPRARQPIRIVLDSTLRTPPDARIFRSRAPVWIAATSRAPARRAERLRRAGAEILRFPAEGGRVSLTRLLRELARREISRLLIEGGGQVAASALRARAVDRIVWVVAPKIIGGGSAVPAVGDLAVRSPDRAVRVEQLEVRRLGSDWIFTGRLEYPARA